MTGNGFTDDDLTVSLVVAAARNGTIGRDGDMPWRLATDLARFKRLTMGRPLVMGRRTFDSIGRPLPGRHTIVVTRDTNWNARGVERVGDPDAALERAAAWANANDADEVCVVGGGEIYRATRERADILRLTTVQAEIEGDTTFNMPEPDRWRAVSHAAVPAGERDSHATRYGVFIRN